MGGKSCLTIEQQGKGVLLYTELEGIPPAQHVLRLILTQSGQCAGSYTSYSWKMELCF
jgi:hypothetical protein